MRQLDNINPATLATKYLTDQWRKETGIINDVPTIVLTRNVVNVVNQLGYTRKVVDKMLESWIKQFGKGK